MIANDSHETPGLPSSADLDAAEERVREATGKAADPAFEEWWGSDRRFPDATQPLFLMVKYCAQEAWDASRRQIAAQTAATPETT